MRQFKSIAFLSAIFFVASCGKVPEQSKINEAWDVNNAPIRISPSFEGRFEALPTSGAVAANKRPWSDSYWPSREGGIASRWYPRVSGAESFYYRPPTEAEVRSMPRNSLMTLSPAEKYDILMGRFDYPTVNSERRRTSPNRPSWEGICHGWAAAALLYGEPRPVDVRSQSGITVPFGSSDVKALLTYYIGTVRYNAGSRFMGSRCNAELNEGSESGNIACRDTNAGAFHVVLTNMVGRMGQGVIIDVDRNYQVWNQPVSGFSTQVLGQQRPSPGSAMGTVREVVVRSQVRYTLEVYPTWNAGQYAEKVVTYNYRLELDGSGRIIGGEWLQFQRPDFLWVPTQLPFDGYWAGIANIYNPMYAE